MSTVFQHAKLADVQNLHHPGAQMAFLIGFTFQTSFNPVSSRDTFRKHISKTSTTNKSFMR